MLQVNKDIIKQSIEHYGEDTESTVCMEELGELVQQISKQKRCCGARVDLIEEIADVYIILDVLKELYSIKDSSIQDMIQYKQTRLKDRMTHLN